jgi:hypothetical protein
MQRKILRRKRVMKMKRKTCSRLITLLIVISLLGLLAFTVTPQLREAAKKAEKVTAMVSDSNTCIIVIGKSLSGETYNIWYYRKEAWLPNAITYVSKSLIAPELLEANGFKSIKTSGDPNQQLWIMPPEEKLPRAILMRCTSRTCF